MWEGGGRPKEGGEKHTCMCLKNYNWKMQRLIY